MKNFTLGFLLFVNVMGFSQASKSSTNNGPKPFVLGTIEQINSKELNEIRTVNIYLPADYNPKDSTKYPVIYLLDGSADEDFIHVVGLVQFNTFEWVNQMPKSIVVGISNVDRKRDFTFPSSVASDKQFVPNSGHSKEFVAFIEKELQPFISRNYKANEQKTLIGQSLGGLLATEILIDKPTLFNNYIIISPSLWWNNGSLLDTDFTKFSASFKQKTKIFIAVGKEGLTPTAAPRVMEVDANSLADKLTSTNSKYCSVYFDYLPLENHASIMHQALINAFKWMYSEK